MSIEWEKWQKEVNEALESSSKRAISPFIENDLREWLGILSPSLMQLSYYNKKEVDVKKKPTNFKECGYGKTLITSPGTLCFHGDGNVESLPLGNSSSAMFYYDSENRRQQAYKYARESFMDVSAAVKALLNPEKEKQMEKLYYNSADEEYGTILAYDKNGNAVFEPRGGGKIKQVSPNSLEEVKPYTVDVTYVGNRGEATYGFQVDKDAGLKVGDIVYATDYNQFVVVIGVDTKTDFATKRLKGNLLTLGQTLE